jgi:hypothetical protein
MRFVFPGWFQLIELGRGVTAIAEPHHHQQVISYLLRGRDDSIQLAQGAQGGESVRFTGSLPRLQDHAPTRPEAL